MPKVPTLGNRVQTQAINSPRFGGELPQGIFGGATSNQFQQGNFELTNTINNILIEEKRKADNLAILEASNRFDEGFREIMYKPETGLLAQKGKNAFGINEAFDEQITPLYDEIFGSLSNDDQRNAFKEYFSRRQSQAFNQIDSHTAKEIAEYDQQQTEFGIENAMEEAATNYRDATVIGESLGRINGLIDAQAERLGLPEEMVKASKDKASSQLHVEVLNRMVAAGEDQRAQAYYRQVSDQILGSQRDNVESILEESSLRGDSQRMADEIFAMNLSSQETLAKAREISDPKRRDETVRRLKVRLQERDAQKQAEKDQQFLNAVNVVEQNPGADVVDLIPAQAWNSFSISERKALQGYHGQRATDPKAWFEFYTMTLEPKQLAQLTPAQFYTKYYSRFAEDDRKRAETLYRQAVQESREGVSGSSITSVIPFNEMVMASMQQAGIISESQLRRGPKKLSSGDFNTFRKITQTAQKRLEEFETSKGSKATPSEKQQLVDNILTEKVIRRDTFLGIDFLNPDEEVVPSLVKEDDDGVFYVPYNSISDDDIRDIERAILNYGRQPTVEMVEQLKAAEMMDDYERVQRILRGDD